MPGGEAPKSCLCSLSLLKTKLKYTKATYSYVAQTCQLKPLWALVAAPDQGPQAAHLGARLQPIRVR